MNKEGSDSRQHLSEDDIDLLVWLRRGGSQPEAGESGLEQLNAHFATCGMCRDKVRSQEEEMAAMQRLLKGGQREAGADCPSPEIWPLAAAGLLASPDAARHAAQCSYCGPLLRQALLDIQSEETEQEIAAISKLPTSRPGMARIIAQSLAASVAERDHVKAGPKPAPRRPPPWIWWAATAAAVAIAGVVFWGYYRQAHDTQALLAQSYASHRTTEWRLAGAAHGPFRVSRGEAANQLEPASPELLRLEARIAEQLAAHPNDPYWLTADGRMNFLLWKYEPALRDFERVRDLQPDSGAALTDLAGAYFERAEATGRAMDYGTTIELLSQALQKDPHNTTALFDRGLANERMYLYGRAAADWEQLLKLEPAGAWADETHRRLEDLKKKGNAR
jgi:tetratricopeptide (TPR) repeat protein